MIKRIVGLLAAVAVLAVVVFAILGSGTYSSFIGRAGRSAAAPAATSVAAPDSTSDSLVNAPEDTTAAGIPADTAAVSGTADTLTCRISRFSTESGTAGHDRLPDFRF